MTTDIIQPSSQYKVVENFSPDVFSIGKYLAFRLQEVGIEHVFTVPGDFTLELLDQVSENPNLKLVGCCNEMNAANAADGYARSRGVSAIIVTSMVGSLAVMSAVAGAYAEHVPIIVICGGINTNDIASDRLLHHSIALEGKNQSVRMMSEITSYSARISHPRLAGREIDTAIPVALRTRRPVYLEICCNIVSSPICNPIPIRVRMRGESNQHSLQVCLDKLEQWWPNSSNPAILIGPNLLRLPTVDEIRKWIHEIQEMLRVPLAFSPSAKGLVKESYCSYSVIGCYWGPISFPSSNVKRIIEEADLILSIGLLNNDYSTAGYSLGIDSSKLISVGSGGQDWQNRRVTFPDNSEFPGIFVEDFLENMLHRLKTRPDVWKKAEYSLLEPNSPSELCCGHWYGSPGEVPRWMEAETRGKCASSEDIAQHSYKKWIKNYSPAKSEEITSSMLMKHLQAFLAPNHTVLAETGDAWFQTQLLLLPAGCRYEIQLQYANLGWCIGATLGQSLADRKRRIIALMGDGAFQISPQVLSTLLKESTNPVIIVLNNGSYSLEENIHPGDYNKLQNWSYESMCSVFTSNQHLFRSFRVNYAKDLINALSYAEESFDKLIFIEIVIDPRDVRPETKKFAKLVNQANMRDY